MDSAKRNKLVNEMLGKTEQLVSIEQFFDGNDDSASIGCNLDNHPGMDAFSSIFTSLLKRPDVQAVFASIAELEPGKDDWPFVDMIYVVGTISPEELRKIVGPLQPDEVEYGLPSGIPELIREKYNAPVLYIWWD